MHRQKRTLDKLPVSCFFIIISSCNYETVDALIPRIKWMYTNGEKGRKRNCDNENIK